MRKEDLMSTRIRIGTFNVENLFARFRFKAGLSEEEIESAVEDGWKVDQTKFDISEEEDKEITAGAIGAIDADVLALQEIENLDVLKRFNTRYLDGKYRYKLLVDGNDPRRIDVGVLSRYPFAAIRTHQFLRTPDGSAWVFSRDCLEVDVELDSGTRLPVFVNHFKSMIGGRDATMDRRKLQSQTMKKILEDRFGPSVGEHKFVVLGDLNDYIPSPGLEPLLDPPWLEDVVRERMDAENAWSHYYNGGGDYRQLDYILLSQSLAHANPNAVPVIERRGLPLRAVRAGPDRFAGVGQDKPKASDHCPVAIDIEV